MSRLVGLGPERSVDACVASSCARTISGRALAEAGVRSRDSARSRGRCRSMSTSTYKPATQPRSRAPGRRASPGWPTSATARDRYWDADRRPLSKPRRARPRDDRLPGHAWSAEERGWEGVAAESTGRQVGELLARTPGGCRGRQRRWRIIYTAAAQAGLAVAARPGRHRSTDSVIATRLSRSDHRQPSGRRRSPAASSRALSQMAGPPATPGTAELVSHAGRRRRQNVTGVGRIGSGATPRARKAGDHVRFVLQPAPARRGGRPE